MIRIKTNVKWKMAFKNKLNQLYSKEIYVIIKKLLNLAEKLKMYDNGTLALLPANKLSCKFKLKVFRR